MRLLIYQVVTILFTPFIRLWLNKRLRRGKEDAARIAERMGYASIERPAGKLVWLHAASVGESLSILPLLGTLTETYPHVHFLVTSGTVTSGKLLAERLPQRCFHQYLPVDVPVAVHRFLDYWKPSAALMVESELWPNLLLATQRTCPVVILNGRMSPRSFQKWQKRGDMIFRLLRKVDLCMAQSAEDGKRYAKLGAPHITYPGNLKFDAPALPDSPAARAALEAMIADRPVWVAASTHPGEEEQLVQAHSLLRENHPTALLILIPRHAHRGSDLRTMLSNSHTVAMRSGQEAITPQTSIYLADTMGELGIFYRLSGIVFMGGSLVEHGGQNPLEPARMGCALLTGTHVHNFPQVYESLHNASAVVTVDSAAALAMQLQTWIAVPELQRSMAANAMKLMNESVGVVARYMDALAPFIPGEDDHAES